MICNLTRSLSRSLSLSLTRSLSRCLSLSMMKSMSPKNNRRTIEEQFYCLEMLLFCKFDIKVRHRITLLSVVE
jgi:hypothetical protein